MAKYGQNDLIFGKLVTSNDLKRPMEDFLKILIFGRFFAFFDPKKWKNRQKIKIFKKSSINLLKSLEITSLSKMLVIMAIF